MINDFAILMIYILLSEINIDFKAINITETSQRANQNFKTNVNIQGYNSPFTTESKSNKGGVAIYVKNNLEGFEHHDLKLSDIEYQSLWVEIKNTRCKNIVCGYIYHHPHYTNSGNFLEYLKTCLTKLSIIPTSGK